MYISTKVRGGWWRAAVLLGVVCVCTVAGGEPADPEGRHEEAQDACALARRLRDEAEGRRDAARREQRDAAAAVAEAERVLAEAQQGSERAEAQLGEVGAALRLAEQELAQLPPEAELTESQRDRRAALLALKASYVHQRDEATRALEEHRAARPPAEESLEAARKELRRKEQYTAVVEGEYQAAETRFTEATSALVRAIVELPPPYLQQLEVKQDGQTVYLARWVPGISVRAELEAQVTELNAEIEELLRRRFQIREDKRRYGGISARMWADFDRAESPHTQPLVYNLIRRMAFVLAAGYDSKMPRITYAGITLHARQAGKNTAANAFRDARIWCPSPEHTLGYDRNRWQIAEGLFRWQESELFKHRSWPNPGPYEMDPFRSLGGGEVCAPGNLSQADAALHRGGEMIDGFPRLLDVMEVNRIVRQSFDRQLLHEVQKAKLPGLMRGGFHAFGRGVCDAMEQAGDQEIRDLEGYLTSRREMVAALAAQRPNAQVRDQNFVVYDKRLEVAAGKRAEMILTFSAELRSEPEVILGEGMEGPGLMSLGPEHQDEGWTTFSCEFDTAPLQPLADSKNGIRVRVSGMDPVGKALDADPTTTAGQVTPDEWLNWEEFRHGVVGEGAGGVDVWHVLNRDPWAGTSFCFVLDASGSMAEGGRMAAAKDSIRTAVTKMADSDEVALWVFYGCDRIQLEVSFTQAKEELVETLERIEPSRGTPIASAIRRARDYLEQHARFRNKALIVLTDGEASCQGDPHAAAAGFRAAERAATAPPREPPPEQPPEQPGVVQVQAADRHAFLVRVEGEVISLVDTHFCEDGRDGACRLAVVERTYFIYHGRTGTQTHWRRSPEPVRVRRLDYVASSQGQAAMDRAREAHRELPGVSWDEARDEIRDAVNRLNPPEEEHE